MKIKIFLTTILLLITTNLVFAEIPIYCQKCKAHIYNYQKEVIVGEVILAKDFIPANLSIRQPQDNELMVCPFDNTPLNGWEIWASRQINKPKFFFNAISLLTKDKDNNWKWIPSDVPDLNLNLERNK